jgi:hypothetical protein
MKHRIAKPSRDGARTSDSFGFALAVATGDPVDLPIPAKVRTWKDAIRYAASQDVYLWARPRVWDRTHKQRRIATIHSMAREMEPRLYTSAREHPLTERIFFEISPIPIQ